MFKRYIIFKATSEYCRVFDRQTSALAEIWSNRMNRIAKQSHSLTPPTGDRRSIEYAVSDEGRQGSRLDQLKNRFLPTCEQSQQLVANGERAFGLDRLTR